jgi:hypothetical protein
MQYGFRADLIRGPPPYSISGIRFPTKLSETDQLTAQTFYPYRETPHSSSGPIFPVERFDVSFVPGEIKIFDLPALPQSLFRIFIHISPGSGFITMVKRCFNIHLFTLQQLSNIRDGKEVVVTSGSSFEPMVADNTENQTWRIILYCRDIGINKTIDSTIVITTGQ